ncbi:MAG: AmmeMemoRadiSam system radical SAM enzyme [candidate division WOR-3 bacterium]|nr:AmmeMemoRadiSam system radical SAM enzyme [candidate division WOR-3 bacterium]MCX7757598.1 AmmeMemoRadiSam system radical SAM enzyme [candidate division WOR-3 bacterium]MDW7987286.1 AmmeMemoRadiSam system radical SAM enzyme [candidate division WOR-3 bacterium]
MVEARYYRTTIKNERSVIICELCPNFCEISEGKVGRCLGRKNINGKLYAINYGEIVSIAMDPIEKKPLYHFYPGAPIFSVATFGCNLRCPFCQNWEISQVQAPSEYYSPENLVKLALTYPTIGIAYTFSEPLVWFEYLLDTMKIARRAGLKNVLVTNGMINPEPLEELLPYVDAMNIDLKSIRDDFYTKFVLGNLDVVKNTIIKAKANCHVELTNLIIPTKNDSKEDIEALVDFCASLGRDTVLHFTRYFPHHKFRVHYTPESTLLEALQIARKKLDFVYLGNIGGYDNNTYCPNCQNLLVNRGYFNTIVTGIKGTNECNKCGLKIYGIFDEER